MIFEWDPVKSDRNRQVRGFGFEVAVLIFRDAIFERVDGRQPYGEVRIKAIGRAEAMFLAVIYTDRPAGRRIISARLADRKERNQWHAQFE